MAKLRTPNCVVGIGEFLWDLLSTGKQLGGAPANFAYHARVLGAESLVVSAVGDDPLGKELIGQLQRIGLSDDFIAVDPKRPTGTVTVQLDAKGVPDFTIHEGVAWDAILFSPGLEGVAQRADSVCFGTLAQRSETSRHTIQTFVQSTRPDCLRMFDVNLRQHYFSRPIIEESLAHADVLKLNDQELPVLARLLSITGSETEILKALLKTYELELIALTQGDRGSRLIGFNDDSFLKTPVVQVIDTVGAGDAFTAALAMGLLQNLPIKTIHENATRLAAFVCTQKGATPELPKGKVAELIRSEKP